jgi:hypothetical protein
MREHPHDVDLGVRSSLVDGLHHFVGDVGIEELGDDEPEHVVMELVRRAQRPLHAPPSRARRRWLASMRRWPTSRP